MTADELKKYKEHIARLKKEFHKDNPENIENLKDSVKQPVADSNTVKKENPFLKALKEGDNFNKKSSVENKISTIDTYKDPKPIDFTNSMKDTEKKVLRDSKPLEKKVEIQNETKVQEKQNLTKEIKPEPQTEVKKEIKKDKPIVVDPPKPPTKNTNQVTDEDENKTSILKYLIPIVLILLIGGSVYFFMNKNKQEQQNSETKLTEQKAFDDSVALYNENILQINENQEENIVAISDTIFNLISNQETGYYAILGSYSELKNANKLKRKQKTNFEAVVFNQNPIRVGLKLNDDSVYENLEEVRKQYPNAWLLYNKN